MSPLPPAPMPYREVTTDNGVRLRLRSIECVHGAVLYELTGRPASGFITVFPHIDSVPRGANQAPKAVVIAAGDHIGSRQQALARRTLLINTIALRRRGYRVAIDIDGGWIDEIPVADRHPDPESHGTEEPPPGYVPARTQRLWDQIVRAVIKDWWQQHDPSRLHAVWLFHIARDRANAAVRTARRQEGWAAEQLVEAEGSYAEHDQWLQVAKLTPGTETSWADEVVRRVAHRFVNQVVNRSRPRTATATSSASRSGRVLCGHDVAAAEWRVLPAGYDADQLEHAGWDEPILPDHGIYLRTPDSDVMLSGSRTVLRVWLTAALAEVVALPPDVRHDDGSLTARTVDPAWADQPGRCPWCGRPLQEDQPIVSGPAGLAHQWCNDELTPE